MQPEHTADAEKDRVGRVDPCQPGPGRLENGAHCSKPYTRTTADFVRSGFEASTRGNKREPAYASSGHAEVQHLRRDLDYTLDYTDVVEVEFVIPLPIR